MCFTLFYGKEKAAKEHRKDAAPTMTEHKSPAVSPMKAPAEAGTPTTKTEEIREEVTPA
jgi:hypothetical protein